VLDKDVMINAYSCLMRLWW